MKGRSRETIHLQSCHVGVGEDGEKEEEVGRPECRKYINILSEFGFLVLLLFLKFLPVLPLAVLRGEGPGGGGSSGPSRFSYSLYFDLKEEGKGMPACL